MPDVHAGSYKEAILFLVTAGVVVPLFHRLRISPVLGFIGAGALLGPFGLGRFADQFHWVSLFTIGNRTEIAHLAEFGVIFLMFMIGVELSWERLRTLRRLVFGLGSIQVICSALVIGSILFGLKVPLAGAVIVGIALALSSTAVVLPVLAEQRRLNTPAGRASFAVLLFQDLAVAPVLFAIAVSGRSDGADMGGALALALAQAAIALVLIVVAGRLALRPLFHLVARTKSAELFMAACLLVIVATALTAAASGLSMTLGAFVAGLLLAETEYRRAIEATIDPFKGLLLGVFFVSVGMNLDPAQLLAAPGAILGLAFALLFIKAAVVVMAAPALKLSRAVALETAMLLGPGGEFAFVLIGGAMAGGLVPEPVGGAALIVTTVTMIMIPGLAALGRRIGKRASKNQAGRVRADPPPDKQQDRVIVAGYGRVGRQVGEMLARHKIPYLALDADAARVAEQRRLGKPVYFGDSSNTELLRRCDIATARALVVTLDNPHAVEAVVMAARAERADLTIVARARDAKHATALYELGVDDAVPETIEASLQLSEAVLVDVGVPMGLVIASIHERRDEYRAMLKRKETDTRPVFRARRTVGKAHEAPREAPPKDEPAPVVRRA
ncbi:cation:proton antiporter [Methylobacterium sp. HMF5984]|jgi:CPA2 family monovalent cation:H+ antiporter-2|uniref:cation:proton antiporter domain-containing protein n=2 Tax=Methylobacterium TaxID=407 RepID=UPI0011CAC148|nr:MULTISPECIES: cation:proton antiporter [unclassified Methylobacterium]MCJ2006978.1 cation:proton antiporter [Methylobacterium sp. J-092]MCJ2040504.1 cation:proton antiporter [Methylobacterium sp. J-059]MCJ2076836.1 cation:proton antiporter [Methylobacterium sp. E-016]MCJ2112331.1 cation:proton antiporter [Methylobacterium sp. E-025]TXM92837.1 potassium transporter TrkA [Methylobacterium sp. WL116]